MRLPIKERAFTTGMVILAAIVVIVLAALQYRWSNQVSEATSIRLADSLQMSMINWHLDFFRDFSEICVAMHVDSGIDAPEDWNQYARRFAEWKKTTAHPDLVSAVYVLRIDEARGPEALRLDPDALARDPAALRFESGNLPPNLADLPEELRQANSQLTSASSMGKIQDPRFRASDREFADRFYSGGPLAGWEFESSIPALVRPIIDSESKIADRGNSNLHHTEWFVIALNEKIIQDQLLPDLAQRYFRGTEGLDYQVAVVAGNKPARVLYTSDADFGGQEVMDADGAMNIFGRLQNDVPASPIHIFHAPSE